MHNISGMNIMHIQLNINADVEINCLTDLPKLKILLESSNMKINKSQLAREVYDNLIHVYYSMNLIVRHEISGSLTVKT